MTQSLMKGGTITSNYDYNKLCPPPAESISARIVPDAWLNIPACIVKAFQADVENQEYLGKLIQTVINKVNLVENKLEDRVQGLKRELNRKDQDVKKELGKQVATIEAKLKNLAQDIKAHINNEVQ